MNKRSSYTAKFKLKVISEAEKTNNSAAARLFGINERQVREWKKNKTVIKDMPREKKAKRGKISQFPNLEEALNIWVLDKRQHGFIVTRTCIRLHALHLAKKMIIDPTEFKASSGWCTNFMNRFDLCMRQKTKIAQKLPAELEDKILTWQRYIIDQRKKHSFTLDQIGNMDETPVTFDFPTNKTVNKRGEKTVLIKTTGHEKTRFTVVLSCLADGNKLPAVVIFKRKNLPKYVKFPSGVLVRAHPNGWMDEDGVKDWLEKVWNQRPGALLQKKNFLIWDAFSAHFTSAVKKKLKSLNSEIGVIPCGLTSVLQPLDVSLNKPFKDRLRKKWIQWMSSDDIQKETTKSGNLKKVDILTIVEWVKQSWDEIPSEMVKKSFIKCCISNDMDGSEDFFSDSDESSLSLINMESESEDIYNADGESISDSQLTELYEYSDSEQ